MVRRVALTLFLGLVSLFGAIPTPKDHFGFTPGDDRKLADYAQITSYFEKLARTSDRLKWVEFGKTSEGRPMCLAIISSPRNLRNLERYKEINRSLALALYDPDRARRAAAEGKAIVWIDSGLHATEVAPAQHAPELAYRMVTASDPRTQRVLDNVILLQVPVINPDGLDMVVKWYRQNVGTPYELAPLPFLYQKYAGHDNNRDWFMLNLTETRHVSRLLFQEWFPQIVYNQHQQPAFPARIFIPPYAEPLNPNIPAAVMQGINLIGAAMAERFALEGKTGVLSYFGFDAWWNGGLRSAPAFHNMHGILTETAASGYATPRDYDPAKLPERFANGMPTKHPGVFYPQPWVGGRWTLRDAIEYMLTADRAILELAAERREEFLTKAYVIARSHRESQAKPYAYVIPPEQWDRSSAVEMVRRLAWAGVEVQRAVEAFQAGGKTYPKGAWVISARQPFRGYLVDLMEPQKYPEIRTGVSGPTKRPYDIAGWTLCMSMGVAVDRIDEPLSAKLEPAGEIGAPAPSLDHRENASFLATIDLLHKGAKVRWAGDGKILVSGVSDAGEFEKGAWELSRPRVALYQPWTANIDTGWIQWLFDTYRIPYETLSNPDIRKGGLRARFDTLVLASQSAASILSGTRSGPVRAASGGVETQQRPEYTGGIGDEGLTEILKFVEQGGTLIAIDAATQLPEQKMQLGIKGLLRNTLPSEGGGTEQPEVPRDAYYCPGSLLRITVDNTHPVAFGMPKEATAFVSGGQVWEVTNPSVRPFVHFASANLLASGWISGEQAVRGKPVALEAKQGQGRVLLFGFRPHFRGQTFGTFKLLLNAVYLGSARKL